MWKYCIAHKWGRMYVHIYMEYACTIYTYIYICIYIQTIFCFHHKCGARCAHHNYPHTDSFFIQRLENDTSLCEDWDWVSHQHFWRIYKIMDINLINGVWNWILVSRRVKMSWTQQHGQHAASDTSVYALEVTRLVWEEFVYKSVEAPCYAVSMRCEKKIFCPCGRCKHPYRDSFSSGLGQSGFSFDSLGNLSCS